MPLLVFVPLSAAGLLFTLTGLVTTVYQPILVGLALLTGALVALEKPPPRPASIALFGVAAMAVGLDSAVEAGTTFAALKTLFGTWMSLGLLVFDFAFYASLLSHKHWQRIDVRVVGSWLTAISLMVLAFALKR